MTVMLLEWVITSVFLIGVVLALRFALGKRMSAGLRYALWAVVLARLLVPVQLFTSPIAGAWVATEQRAEQVVINRPAGPAVSGNVPADGVLSLPAGVITPDNVSAAPSLPDAPTAPALPEPPDLSDPPEWVVNLGWIWLAGAALAAFVLLLSNLRFYWQLRRVRIPMEAADCPLRVYMAVGLPSPCLFGIIRPAVYVTPEAADPVMFRHMLAHEYTHFRHGDHLWSLLRCAALAVHWWNPLVWLSAVLSRRDAELACDEGALKRLGDSERAKYGTTLLALVTARPRPGDLFRCATTMAGDKKSLKERVSRIASAPKRILWVALVAVAVTALACVCAFGQAAEPEDESDPPPSASQQAEPELPGMPDGLADVLRGKSEFVLNQNESPITISDVPALFDPDDSYMAVQRYAAVDLDGNGAREVLVYVCGVSGDMGGYLLLWEEDGEAHGEVFSSDGWRNHWFIDLKTDGTFGCTDPLDGDFWRSISHLRLSAGGWALYSQAVRRITDSFGNPIDLESFMVIERETTEEEYAEALAAQGAKQNAVWYELPSGNIMAQTADLTRDGVPEILQIDMIDGGIGQRLGVWESDKLIFEEEGYYAHAGYNALFLCTLDGQDYLLRYNPYMGQGWCEYSYQLFTLENGVETVSRENHIEFDVNFGLMHVSFDPEAIAAFMDEINGLLAHSVQLINTDADLLDIFQKEGRLYDSHWWLDGWEPGFVRDENASMLENLRAYKEAMEAEWYAAEPELANLSETSENARVWIRYRDKDTKFDADYWDFTYQPAEQVDIQVLDLNGDGKDELVFSLVWGHGTGTLVEKLYVFDAETLEQYDTSGLNEMILGSVVSTGDEDNFYLDIPAPSGKSRVTIPKSEVQKENPYPLMADKLCLGNIIGYTIQGNQVFCRLGCDASGMTLNYIGYIDIPVKLDLSGNFSCGSAQYTTDGLF